MGSRTLSAIIILFWLFAMSWLVVDKVLPPLMVGEPPTQQQSAPPEDAVIGWKLSWAGQPLGWAATRLVSGEDGAKEIHSRAVLEDLPLSDILPLYLRPVLREHVNTIDVDTKSRFEFDSSFNLLGFRTTVQLSEMESAIRMIGRVERSLLKLHVYVGEFRYEKDAHLDQNALLTDEFTPQAKIPDLYLGRTWTTRTYSPFHSPNAPLEILQAKVEREEMIEWDGKAVSTHVVVFRPDAGAGLAASTRPRGTLWVDKQGNVLRQEMLLLDSVLRFTRLPDETAREQGDLLDDAWLTGEVVSTESEKEHHD